MSYDPLQRHIAIEKLITRTTSEGQAKKYYRIRPARWYGGIVTADCVGCGLTCRFCWVSDAVMSHPSAVGKFYTPDSIASGLVALARKKGLGLLRISGGEPTIGKNHLLQLLDQLRGKGCRFILETNGIPIACDEDYARDLSRYDFIHVRVSLKGCNEKEFAILTGARKEGYSLQLESLRNLTEAGVSCHPSVMASFWPRNSIEKLIDRLSEISPNFAEEIEIEELILYPHVMIRMQKYGLKHFSGYRPNGVPANQI